MNDIAELRTLLTRKSIPEIVYRHILTGKPICFDGNEDLVYELHDRLSKHFAVHNKDIEVVGSAKIGFSLNPRKNGRAYSAESDIDLAIVSEALFIKCWREFARFQQQSELHSDDDADRIQKMLEYLPQGIVSPDQLPGRMEFRTTWWDVFRELSENDRFGPRKIRGRLFKDWWFAELYYSKALASLSAQ